MQKKRVVLSRLRYVQKLSAAIADGKYSKVHEKRKGKLPRGGISILHGIAMNKCAKPLIHTRPHSGITVVCIISPAHSMELTMSRPW